MSNIKGIGSSLIIRGRVVCQQQPALSEPCMKAQLETQPFGSAGQQGLSYSERRHRFGGFLGVTNTWPKRGVDT